MYVPDCPPDGPIMCRCYGYGVLFLSQVCFLKNSMNSAGEQIFNPLPD